LHREKFWKQHEVTAVVSCTVYKELDLGRKFVKTIDGTQQVLHSGHPHAARPPIVTQGLL